MNDSQCNVRAQRSFQHTDTVQWEVRTLKENIQSKHQDTFIRTVNMRICPITAQRSADRWRGGGVYCTSLRVTVVFRKCCCLFIYSSVLKTNTSIKTHQTWRRIQSESGLQTTDSSASIQAEPMRSSSGDYQWTCDTNDCHMTDLIVFKMISE